MLLNKKYKDNHIS